MPPRSGSRRDPDVFFAVGDNPRMKIFQRDAAGNITGFIDRRETGIACVGEAMGISPGVALTPSPTLGNNQPRSDAAVINKTTISVKDFHKAFRTRPPRGSTLKQGAGPTALLPGMSGGRPDHAAQEWFYRCNAASSILRFAPERSLRSHIKLNDWLFAARSSRRGKNLKYNWRRNSAASRESQLGVSIAFAKPAATILRWAVSSG